MLRKNDEPRVGARGWSANRKQTKLLQGVKKQINYVESALAKGKHEIPVFGALAFYKAQFPLLFSPVELDGILINGKGIEAAVFSKRAKAQELDYDVRGVADFLLKAFPAKWVLRITTGR